MITIGLDCLSTKYVQCLLCAKHMLEDRQPKAQGGSIIITCYDLSLSSFFSLCCYSSQYFLRCTFQLLLQGSTSQENYGLLSFAIFCVKSSSIPLFGTNHFLPSAFQALHILLFCHSYFFSCAYSPLDFKLPDVMDSNESLTLCSS